MSLANTTIGQCYAYSAELLRDRDAYTGALESVSEDTVTRHYLAAQSGIRLAGMGLLAKQMYDIAHIEGATYPTERTDAARIGGLTILLADIIDDEIDRQAMPLEEKYRYLDQSLNCWLYGQAPPPESTFPLHGNGQAVKASFELGHYLFLQTAARDSTETFQGVIEPLVANVKEQLVSEDQERQLMLIKEIGARCGEIAGVAVEAVDGKNYPDLITAARGVGKFAHCLDNAYEIKKDVEEGAVTYVTLLLRQDGNTAKNRSRAKKVLLGESRIAYAEGSVSLSARQLVTYRAIRRLLEAKYKIYGRLTSH